MYHHVYTCTCAQILLAPADYKCLVYSQKELSSRHLEKSEKKKLRSFHELTLHRQEDKINSFFMFYLVDLINKTSRNVLSVKIFLLQTPKST